MRLGKTTLLHFASQAGKSLAGFLATLAIARFLGPDTLGIYAVAVAMIFWITIPASAFKEAINKRVSEGLEQEAFLSAGLVWNIALGLAVSLLVVVFAHPVNTYVGANVAELIAILLLGNIGIKTVQGALEGQKKVAQTGALNTIERILRTGLQIGFILLGLAITGLLLGHAISLFIVSILGFMLFNTGFSWPAKRHFTKLWEFARYSWLGSLKTRSFAWMDTVVLAFFVSSTFIGIYEVAWSLASTLALISISVKTTLFPEMSGLSLADDYDRIHHYLNEGIMFTGVFAIPGFFGALALGPRVLKIYRPEFKAGTLILLILIIARLLAAYEAQMLGVINAIDRPDIAFRVNTVFILANLILNVTLVGLFQRNGVGWYGAAIATAVSSGIALVLSYRALTELIGSLSIPYKETGYQLTASVVMALVVQLLAQITPGNHYLTIGLVFLGAIVYTIVLLLLSTRIRTKAVALMPKTQYFHA